MPKFARTASNVIALLRLRLKLKQAPPGTEGNGAATARAPGDGPEGASAEAQAHTLQSQGEANDHVLSDRGEHREGGAPVDAIPTSIDHHEEERAGRPSVQSSRRSSNDRREHPCHVKDNTGRIEDRYTFVKEKIGKGGFGSVFEAKHKKSRSVCAVKSVSKAHKSDIPRFRQEIEIMKAVDHPNIVRLFETFDDPRSIHLVMEMCAGGQLMDSLRQAKHFPEARAGLVMRQVFYAVNYLHRNLICHRDLKLENFLLRTHEPVERNVVKVADFGLSRNFEPNQVMATKVGTVHYWSPDMLSGRYDKSCDMWSCGVSMFALLSGAWPFDGKTDADICSRVRRANYSFHDGVWGGVSDASKNLIRGLLKFQPVERCTAQGALEHQSIHDGSSKVVPQSCLEVLEKRLRGYHSESSLRRAGLRAIVQQLDEAHHAAQREAFVALDTDSDGVLAADELLVGLRRSGLEAIPEDLQRIVDWISPMDYTEFLAVTLDEEFQAQESDCRAAFGILDRDGDGRISVHEVEVALGRSSSKESQELVSYRDFVKVVNHL